MPIGDEVLSSFTQKVRQERTYAERKLKVGIIGTGWIAEAHVESYLRQPDVEIVALADLIDGKAEAFARRYGLEAARCYPDHASMLAAETLDAVSVCTYNVTHAECTIDALRAGVHVLLEKPMCVTLDEAADIMRAEKASGKILTVGEDAQKMLGRTSGNIIAICPLREGVISDYEMTERMIKEFIKKVLGFGLCKPSLVV